MAGSNRILDPGNVNAMAPYVIAGKTGTLTGLVAGNAVATLVQSGMLINGSATLQLTPIGISQVRMKYIPVTTPATNGVAFEVYRGASSAQRTTGGNLHAPVKRKRTGYPAIATAETSLYVADTGVISGGNFTPDDATGPFDMMCLGASTALSGGESVWCPSDLSPHALEVGDAMEVRVTQFSGTGILLVAFDFVR